jgi:hypothetical protein
MALTAFQRSICHLLAPLRKERESYVAGGVALNTLLHTSRLSVDIDLFHDTSEALATTVREDQALLEESGYEVAFVRDAIAYAEARVSKGNGATLIQWVRDSAFRFFPLEENEDFGITLNPFDLATNKVLAMAGRLEPRDWIDTMNCCEKLQPLGFLVWAACGKDPGFNPSSLLQQLQRSTRYSQAELDILDFEGETPDATELGGRWHKFLQEAKTVIDCLATEHLGECVLNSDGGLCKELPDNLSELRFHQGRIGGALPSFPQ